MCQIRFSDPNNPENSVKDSIEKLTNDPYGNFLQDSYECANCPIKTNATQNITLLNVSDSLIIQLVIFSFNQTTGAPLKLSPNLAIETKIENILLGTFELTAIIYHHGHTANSGHYTAVVKHGEQWYSVDDDRVLPIEADVFKCSVKDHMVPYILLYRKFNREINLMPVNANNQLDNPDHIKDDINVSTGCSKSPIPTEKRFSLTKDKKNESGVEEFVLFDKQNSEQMMKRALLKEIKIQEHKITQSRKKLVSEKENSTPIKRKRRISTKSKKFSMKKARYNLNDIKKELFRETDKERKQEYRENQDAMEKEKDLETASKRMKNLRQNQDTMEKEKDRETASKRMKNLRENQDPVEKEKYRETASKRMKNLRQNQDPMEKEKDLETASKRMKNLRQNQDTMEKEKDRSTASKRMKNLRQNQDPVEKEKYRETASKRMKNLRQNQDPMEKEKIIKSDQLRKKKFREHQDAMEKEKDRETASKRMKNLRENQDPVGKEKDRSTASKRMKNLRQNQDPMEKEKDRETSSKRMKNLRQNQDDLERENTRVQDKLRKKNYRLLNKIERDKEFHKVQSKSMADPSITLSKAFEIVKQDFDYVISEGPTNKCHICIKWEYKGNAKRFLHKEYENLAMFQLCDVPNTDCDSEEIYWICHPCDKAIKKEQLPVQAQANNLQLSPKLPELEELCPIEMMLVSQIIPFMFIVPKHKGGQQGLKGQCVMVPANLDKIQKVLPRVCTDEFLISLALKRRLSDKSSVNKQNIRPAFVTKALQRLVEVNKFYENIAPNYRWEDESLRSDPELWSLLTDQNAQPQEDESDSDDNIEGNDNNLERQMKNNNSSQPTLLYDIDGAAISSEKAIDITLQQSTTDISSDQVVNIAPCENEIPVSFYSEPDWEALAFPAHYPDAKNYSNSPRDKNITPSKYIHARLKSSDDRFASDPQYIFSSLHWIESSNVASAISFSQQKHFQSDISAGRLMNPDNVRQMISDDQIFQNSFKSIRGTPQWCHNMMLDVLAKCRVFGPSTYFLTWTAALFKWTNIIKVVATQYGENLTDEDVNNMDWSQKVQYFKRNPVTVARQIDHIFNKVFPKMLMNGMHPIGQILNYDDRREFQHRSGLEHVHAQIHIKDAPIIDEKDSSKDNQVVDFIDNYITCSLPDKNEYPKLYELVNTVQKHHHTTTCRKKSGSRCRFKAPWPPCEETRIIRGKQIDKNDYRASKKILDKVLDEINNCSSDLQDISLDDLLRSCDISRDEYFTALDMVQKKITVLYKRTPNETNIGPYNTVMISILQSNMNIQYVTNMYAVLAYITSYMCKPERNMSELMKKAHKEASGKDVKDKLRAIGNVFLTKREVSTHEAIKRTLSLKMKTSNINVEFVITGPKEKRTRILKSPSEVAKLDPDSKNVYKNSMFDKYQNRPNKLKDMCLADFASIYTYQKKKENEEEIEEANETDDEINETLEIDDNAPKTITLKNGMGKMRKRSRPCVIRYHKVSKLKERNEYFMVLLQLFMPWENENDLKGNCDTFEEKFNEVEEEIKPNILKHDPYFGRINDVDLNDIHVYDSSDSESSDDEQDDDYRIIHPDLIDLDYENEAQDATNESSSVPFTTSDQNPTMSLDRFYNMCSNLNILKEPGQNIDREPSVFVTASTGKAAANVDGTTLHSAFVLPIYDEGRGIMQKRDLTGNALHELRLKFKYLKVLLIDEISMIGKRSFDDLNRRLQEIKQIKEPFGDVALLLIGDFFQLPPIKQNSIYKTKLDYAWEEFKLYELDEIVRQSGDSEFAALLNRLREGNHTKTDIEKIQSFEHTDTAEWPENFMKMYITNNLKDQQNEKSLKSLQDWDNKRTSIAKDESRQKVTLNKYVPINKTAGLPKELILCVGARVMLTINKDVEDKLINGSTGIVKHIQGLRDNKPCGVIYVQFDNPLSGNKLKNARLKGELKTCVPVQPEVKTFKTSKNIYVTRKQFPLIVAFATTIHKAQGSTLEYASGDLDQTTRSGKGLAPVGPGLLYRPPEAVSFIVVR
ncbi:uncharacterized protein [Clytia hemisphaerica]|uniref:uncharacterized protein n=1 Tax=Clytia hemisphaerica TaxID=252671 RepID=UPI0034D60061